MTLFIINYFEKQCTKKDQAPDRLAKVLFFLKQILSFSFKLFKTSAYQPLQFNLNQHYYYEIPT
jgi:hypothetical protein